MAKRLNTILSNQKGFTLVEVMIALTIFALFITAFLMSQGSNITMSQQMSEDIMLHNLAERKINEALLNPPVFTNATENDVEEKNFEEEGFTKFRYKIEYKKLEIPDMNQLMGRNQNGESEDDDYANADQTQRNDAVTKMVFEKLRKNIEQMIWQVKVTITNTETDYSYELSSWVTNEKAQMDTNFGF